MFNTPMDEDEPYSALSHTWGDPAATRTILLNGGTFPVTVNLELALRRIQEDNTIRYLWVDAICT